MTSPVIDAHQHFWHPARGDYGWLSPDDAILSRPYVPADLAPLLESAGVDRTILVQAAPTLAETEYMLGIADATPFVAGVVGWIDFNQPDQLTALQHFASHPKFLGLRPMIQDITDPNWMLRDDVQWAFRAILELDLTFDGLGFPIHINPFLTVLKRYPGLRMVLDHCLKPHIATGEGFALWADGLESLAAQGAWCKLSGSGDRGPRRPAAQNPRALCPSRAAGLRPGSHHVGLGLAGPAPPHRLCPVARHRAWPCRPSVARPDRQPVWRRGNRLLSPHPLRTCGSPLQPLCPP